MPISAQINPMSGTLVGVNILFVDDTGAPTDPTDVIIQAIRQDGSLKDQADILVSNIGVGIWHAEFIVDRSGTWTVQAKGLGALIVVEEASFDVRRRTIP